MGCSKSQLSGSGSLTSKTFPKILIVDIFLLHFLFSVVIGGVVRLAPADSARSGEGHVTRHYRLWNDCSRRYVQMIDSTVNAQGHSHSPFAGLYAVSMGTRGAVQLMSDATGGLLCFNKKGNLVVRTRPAGSHNKHCLFKEHYNLEHNMFEYYSLADPTWRLGFGKYGKALAANRWLKVPSQARCFRFMKSPVEHKHRHQHHKDVTNARVDSGAVNLHHPPHVPQSHVEVRPEDVTVHRHTGAAGSRTKTSPRENENNVVTTHRT